MLKLVKTSVELVKSLCDLGHAQNVLLELLTTCRTITFLTIQKISRHCEQIN